MLPGVQHEAVRMQPRVDLVGLVAGYHVDLDRDLPDPPRGAGRERIEHRVLGAFAIDLEVVAARDAGAVKVYLASAAPPVRHPNVYGIDMPTRAELVAHDRTEEEIRQVIGADALIYQDVAAMKQAVGKINPGGQGFEASCFDGLYITGDISDEEVTALNEGRQRGGEDDEEDTSRLSLPNAQE